MYTNVTQHGGVFLDALDAEFATADNIAIASGYTSLITIKQFQDRLINIARNGGESKLLLGMARYEGLGQKQLDGLTQLHSALQTENLSSGVYIADNRRYHGKIYRFDSNGKSHIYLGSSNFSTNGIRTNIECTVPVLDDVLRRKVIAFLNDLYSPNYSTLLDKIEIRVKGTKDPKHTKAIELWNGLQTHTIKYGNINTNPFFAVTLNRINEQEKSCLNVYFGKGREDKVTGKIIPRPWYEVELTANSTEISNPHYPRGDFLAYTDDNLIIPMRAQGDNNKNIQSKDNLQIFGMWIKGKLERAGALDKYEPVTEETLNEYGNNEVRFYRIENNQYYMTF